jgi:predicted nucleotidyltransferase
MRLTAIQIASIQQSVARIVGSSAHMAVYGSRLNDHACGGDLELLITDEELPKLIQKARLKLELESTLVMPVDVLTVKRSAVPTPFQRIALAASMPLGAKQ